MSDVESAFRAGLEQISGALANFWSVWTFYQAGIILACLAVGWFLARLWTPPLEDRIRRLTGQPRLMRLLVIPLRRLSWMISAVLLWIAALVMQEVTWPSRSYLVVLAAQLIGAWVLINIASRMIRNRSVAQVIAVLAWAVAALAIVGYLDNVAAFLDGIGLTVGSKRVTLLALIKGTFAFALLIWIAFVVSDFVDGRLRLMSDLTPTYQVLVGKLFRAVLLVAAVLMALDAIGVDLTALAVFSGALGIGLGFGLQKIAANLISGVIILLDKSIKPGDVITVGDTFGWITRLQSRYVSVNTRDGVEHLIPNEMLISESVINWSHSNRQVRLDIHIGVSYSDDPHLVRRIVVAAIQGLDRVIESPTPVCHITGFGDSSIDLIVRFWIADPENGTTNVRGAAYLAIWDTFKDHGVTIPFPHRQLLMSDQDRARLRTAIDGD